MVSYVLFVGEIIEIIGGTVSGDVGTKFAWLDLIVSVPATNETKSTEIIANAVFFNTAVPGNDGLFDVAF